MDSEAIFELTSSMLWVIINRGIILVLLIVKYVLDILDHNKAIGYIMIEINDLRIICNLYGCRILTD